MLIFTTTMFQQPKTNIPSLYCQESTYLELSTLEGYQPQKTTCCIPTYSTNIPITYKCTRNIFWQPQDSHWSTTTTPIAISSYYTHLESKIILLLTFISNLITSTEYTPRKLTYSNSKETTTFHLGTLLSRYHIELN